MLVRASYLSHQPILVSAFFGVQGGRVLELGCGYGSTPILNALCCMHECELITLESDEEWAMVFEQFTRDWHTLKVCDSFADIEEYNEKWDIAIVDHAQEALRGHSVARLHGMADVVRAHDSNYADLYRYREAFDLYKYRLDYHGIPPQTTALSDFEERLDRMLRIVS